MIFSFCFSLLKCWKYRLFFLIDFFPHPLQIPKMCQIIPSIDRVNETLTLSAAKMVPLTIHFSTPGQHLSNLCQAKVCSERYAQK
jgi:hypothetical protein